MIHITITRESKIDAHLNIQNSHLESYIDTFLFKVPTLKGSFDVVLTKIPRTWPNKSHFRFPYFFSDTNGFDFGEFQWDYDMAIYYDSLTAHQFIDCRCTRWDVSNDSIIVETFISKADSKTLKDNIVPGAVGELYKILGKKKYYDKTWTGSNTLRILPTPNNNLMKNSKLKSMRDDTYIFVKNYTERTSEDVDNVSIKIEGYVSGNVR